MNDIRTGKLFSAEECNLLIYALELKAALFGYHGLQSSYAFNWQYFSSCSY